MGNPHSIVGSSGVMSTSPENRIWTLPYPVQICSKTPKLENRPDLFNIDSVLSDSPVGSNMTDRDPENTALPAFADSLKG